LRYANNLTRSLYRGRCVSEPLAAVADRYDLDRFTLLRSPRLRTCSNSTKAPQLRQPRSK
jgi:hypothetical protein